MKQKRQPKKDHGRKPNGNPNNSNTLYAGIAVLILVLIFGKVIAVSGILMSVGWIAGKVVKRIDKRRAT